MSGEVIYITVFLSIRKRKDTQLVNTHKDTGRVEEMTVVGGGHSSSEDSDKEFRNERRLEVCTSRLADDRISHLTGSEP